MTVTAQALPLILAELEAVSVQRLSPSFVRVELASPELADFGVEGNLYDQRIKLIFPAEGHPLPSIEGADGSWLDTWLDRPLAERGHMRTYTVRDVRGVGTDTRLVVDIVIHEDGHAGPGARWAMDAAVGDRLLTLAPRRGQHFGGIEFVPGDARRLLLVGDETALPAIASILGQLPRTARGEAFLELPWSADRQLLDPPPGIEVHWCSRGAEAPGSRVVPAVRSWFGLDRVFDPAATDEVDPDLWETPTYSSSGAELDDHVAVGHDLDGLYAWIAGESRMVTTLRRALVNELEIDRHQVAFMGYWRQGVAMKP